jgi:cytochrome c biogenesis protein ResB
VEVNHPVSYKGIQIYQSSFDDGGSHVTLRALPMAAASASPSRAPSAAPRPSPTARTR